MALPRIIEAVEAQLFGIIAEEKEAGAFAGTREAKRLRAYDTFQILASNATFRDHLASLLEPVQAVIAKGQHSRMLCSASLSEYERFITACVCK